MASSGYSFEAMAILGTVVLLSSLFGLLILIWVLTLRKKPVLWTGAEIVSWASSSVLKGPDGSYQMPNAPWSRYDDVVLRLNIDGQMQNRRYRSIRVIRGLALEPGPANLLVIEDRGYKPGKLTNAMSILALDQGRLVYSPINMRESLSNFGAGCIVPMLVIGPLSVILGLVAQVACSLLATTRTGADWAFFKATPLCFITLTAIYIIASIWTNKRFHAKVEQILQNAYPDQYFRS